jgi:putative nucleotidyltransferase with HDIG domain
MSITSEQLETRPTVLVVDDEAGPRDSLKVILRPFFDIHAAENAKTALEVLRSEPIDLITLDQKLPDRHGLDLLQEIKRDHPNVEVVIITGYGSLRAAMEGTRHGAAGYLLKPFNINELITLIQQTMEKKRRLDFLRHCLKTSTELWGSEGESVGAWDRLKAGYFALCTKSEGDFVSEQEEGGMNLLPLLSDILEATDRQLLNHSSRVSFNATLMAARLSLTLSEQKTLAMGAFLHDIGKAGLPSYRFAEDQILPSGEPAVCKEHCDRGARLIKPLGLPIEVGQIIASHHERWDGQGYPRGLQGAEIPLLARIVCIAQAFDHLTADTPGRSSLSIDAAIHQISLQSHTHFDPLLLELFIDVVKESTASIPATTIAPAA